MGDEKPKTQSGGTGSSGSPAAKILTELLEQRRGLIKIKAMLDELKALILAMSEEEEEEKDDDGRDDDDWS